MGVAGFLLSCTILLAVSWALVLLPDLSWRGRNPDIVGVPVKDRIAQSSLFVLCVFGLIATAAVTGRQGRGFLTVGLLLLSLLFFANVLFVAGSRTALIVIPILLMLFGARQFGWKGLAGALVTGIQSGSTEPLISRARAFCSLTLAQTHAYSPAILVDELDAGPLKSSLNDFKCRASGPTRPSF